MRWQKTPEKKSNASAIYLYRPNEVRYLYKYLEGVRFMNYFSDNTEWTWLFKNAVFWDKIIPLYYPKFPTEEGFNNAEEAYEFFKEIMDSTGSWCGDKVLNRATRLDQTHAGTIENFKTVPSAPLQELYNEARELEIFGLPLPKEHGGLETPVILYLILVVQLSRGCLASSTQIAFFTSIGDMVNRFLSKEDRARLVPLICRGEISGSMNMTEPGAGSDIGLITTMAKPVEGTSNYKITGSKIFITNGGGGLAFVLARTPDAPKGMKGLSLFFVEQTIKDSEGNETLNFKVTKNEEKMGMNGSFTTEVVFENSLGSLVGNIGDGFKIMSHLMNEARLAVSAQALGGIEGSLDYALNYAKEREQFGKSISDLPLLKRQLADLCTERDAIRAMVVDSLAHFDIFQKIDLKKHHGETVTAEEEKLAKVSSQITRLRTPLAKFYACESYTTISSKAIQVLGGHGLMTEHPVERYHRDSYGPLLYEGTSQIQSLMAMKDLLKGVMKSPLKVIGSMITNHCLIGLLTGKNKIKRTLNHQQYVFSKNLLCLIWKNYSPSKKNVDKLMEHAESLCWALSYIETLKVLHNHALKDSSRSKLFNDYHRLIMPRLTGIYCDWKLG
jgi:3-(methylthio)propanoyl-CoA dehydrogenase